MHARLSLLAALAACGDSGGDTTGNSTTAGPATIPTVSATDDTPTDGAATDDATVGGNSEALTSSTGPGATDGTSPEATSAETGPPANCGDGVLDVGEQCDDGANNGPMAACYPDCTANVCGDGVQSPDEPCDLGADNGPDSGCSVECALLPSSCGNQAVEAELTPQPVDIIIVIDNSGSMSAEIQGVQDNINTNFAQILDASGLDYRVILVAAHGDVDEQSVCIEAPLSGIPEGGCANPPNQPVNNPGRFYHYSRTISSHNAWCKLLTTATGVEDDDFDFAVDGWQEWLRPDSFKTFVVLTDDDVSCDDFNDGSNSVDVAVDSAEQFDAALRALLPQHFGDSPDARNYRWYSLIGMAYNDPPELPYGPMDPLVFSTCPEGEDEGPGYQALSNLTGGTKFPLCNTDSYDVVFQAIAAGVLDSAKLACEFAIPEPPMGKTLDEDSVTVIFTPMGMGIPVNFNKVDSPDLCTPTSFYLEAGQVILCPDACAAIQGDKDATLEVEFTCDPLVPL